PEPSIGKRRNIHTMDISKIICESLDESMKEVADGKFKTIAMLTTKKFLNLEAKCHANELFSYSFKELSQ
ncbi:hypothetical protein CRH03_25590, partial [Clostridium sp. HMb25]